MQIYKKLLNLGLPLFLYLMFLGHSFALFEFTVINKLERYIYDQQVKLTLTQNKKHPVVIANIDEKSINQLGQWPWRRDVMAQFVNTMFEHYQVKVLGFDMVFSEPSDNTSLEVLELLNNSELQQTPLFQNAYQTLKSQLNFDQQFANSLTNRNVVLGLVFERQSQNKNQLPNPLARLPQQMINDHSLITADNYLANLVELHKQSPYAGFFDNPLLDSDGVFRRVPLVQTISGYVYPSLALEMARLYLADEPIQLNFASLNQHQQLTSIELNNQQVKVGQYGEVMVPYLAPGSFDYLSIIDLLQLSVPVEALKNKIVLVGTNAAGLLDLRTTPFSSAYPGVEVHANIIAGLVTDQLKHHPNYQLEYQFITISLVTLLLLLLAKVAHPGIKAAIIGGLIVSLIFVTHWAWLKGVIFPIATPLLLLICSFILFTLFNLILETKNRVSITKQFGLYVPPALVNKMSKNPQKYELKSQHKVLTVLFADIRDFTTIAESLSPEQLSKWMNRYLTVMTKIIHRHHGTIDKYMGDAIMAFWGAPIDDEQHAQNSVNAANDMATQLTELNQEFIERGWPTISMGIGINTDSMFVGNMGSEFRKAYTVMGDAVNLASRLEALTKYYGVNCLISASTSNLIDGYHPSLIDKVKVKGKTQAVEIFALNKQPLNKSRSDFWHAYLNQNWPQAKVNLAKLAEDPQVSQQWCEQFGQRIHQLQNKGKLIDWDGSYHHVNK